MAMALSLLDSSRGMVEALAVGNHSDATLD